MKRVYLVRHGETFSNVDHTFQGPDELLTDRGIKQAGNLARRIANLDFEKLIVSDYRRAQMTAEPITELTGVQPLISPLFHEERRPTSWIGRSELTDEGKQFYWNLYNKASDSSWYIEDMETPPETLSRVKEALAFLENQAEENIVVVSHGCFLKQFMSYLILDQEATVDELARMRKTLKISNTGISMIYKDDERWRVLSWNDHSHFAE